MSNRVSKLGRIDRVRNNVTPEKLYRYFGELELFGEPLLEEQTIRFMCNWCPDYFFEIPSSGTGKYHPPDEYNTAGNVLHVKRVFLAYEQLARSYLEQQLIDVDEYYCGQAAVLLHDMYKFGWPSENQSSAVPDHDILAAEAIRRKSDLPPLVADMCASHNGAWGEGPVPDSPIEQLLHMADMTVAPRWYRSDVLFPSEELQALGVEAVDVELLQE